MQDLIKAIAVTAELTGSRLSEGAALAMAEDLARFPERQVLAALKKCRLELRTRLTIADVVARIDDGRPGPEEAWAMVPKSERESVVWTAEIALAYGVCAGLVESDPIAARMAFKEAYVRELAAARESGDPPAWSASLGHDVHGREAALQVAVERGRLSYERAAEYMPLEHRQSEALALAGAAVKRLQ